MPRGDVTSLPMWAQQHIAQLESELDKYRLHSMSLIHSGDFAVQRPEYPPTYHHKDSHVRITVGPGRLFHFWTEVDTLMVQSSERLLISPVNQRQVAARIAGKS